MKFVKLPSGTLLNLDTVYTAYSRNEGKSVRFCFSSSEEDYFDEDMTAADLDALLSPTTSAIVSPVLELRIPNIGDAVMFDWHGTNRHGVVFAHHEDDQKLVITSHGEDYQYDLPTGYIIKIQ